MLITMGNLLLKKLKINEEYKNNVSQINNYIFKKIFENMKTYTKLKIIKCNKQI